MIVEAFSVNIQGILVFSVIFLIILWIQRSFRKPNNLPPGPPALPVLGSIPFFSHPTDSEKSFSTLFKTYGDIFHVYIFNRLLIAVNSYDLIRDVLVRKGNITSNRPQSYLFKTLSNGLGVVNSNGHWWKEQRRFTLSTLRDFGMGKLSLEGKIMGEVEVLLEGFQKHAGQPHDPTYFIGMAVCNIIYSIVFGKRKEQDDEQFQRFLGYISTNLKEIPKASIMDFYPWLKYIPGDPFCYYKILKRIDEGDKVFKQEIDQHRKNFDPDNITDLIDAFLKEQEENKDNENTSFTDDQLLKLIGDLFVAGSETSASTIRWAIFYLIRYPDIQKRIQEELDQVIGDGHVPSVQDRSRLPYLTAFILETQRKGNIVPAGVPHCNNEEITINGYTIPKGTTIMPILGSILNDPKLFESPESFDPEHFLNEDGTLRKVDEFIPFSIGPRVCPGESLAKMEIFLFLTSMLQKFTFCMPEGETQPESLRKEAVVKTAPSYKMCTIER